MLVIGRTAGQTIKIGDEIKVTVLKGNRIGIEAPPDVKILRGEITDRPKRTEGVKERLEPTTQDA